MKSKTLSAAMAAGVLTMVACGAGNGDGGGGLSGSGDSGGADGDYPAGSIELIVPFNPGGGADFTGRTIAEHVQDELGESVTVVNVEGGGGQIGGTELVNQAPDGYTIGLISNSVINVYPYIRDTAYDAEDFEPIVRAAVTRQVFQVSEDAPWGDLDDFLSYAEENPGQITYGTSGVGTTAHLVMEMFQRETGVELEHVVYDGLGAAKTDVMGGNLDAAVGPVTDADEGRIRGLFSLSGEQGQTPDDVPLAVDHGIDASLDVIHYIVAPPDTPQDIKDTLESAFEEALSSDETISAFDASEIEIDFGGMSEAEQQISDASDEMRILLDELDLSEDSE